MKRSEAIKELQLNEVLHEIEEVLRRCEVETSYLEDVLSAWAMEQQDAQNFPTMQLQRLDYLKQVQGDLCVIVHNIASHLANLHAHDFVIAGSELLLDTKLKEVRERLLNSSHGRDGVRDTFSASLDESSDVHFF